MKDRSLWSWCVLSLSSLFIVRTRKMCLTLPKYLSISVISFPYVCLQTPKSSIPTIFIKQVVSFVLFFDLLASCTAWLSPFSMANSRKKVLFSSFIPWSSLNSWNYFVHFKCILSQVILTFKKKTQYPNCPSLKILD